MAERLIPLAAMEKILREAGAERVSDDAKAVLKEVIEDKAVEIAKRASAFAIHAGRKTVQEHDVKLALKEFYP